MFRAKATVSQDGNAFLAHDMVIRNQESHRSFTQSSDDVPQSRQRFVDVLRFIEN